MISFVYTAAEMAHMEIVQEPRLATHSEHEREVLKFRVPLPKLVVILGFGFCHGEIVNKIIHGHVDEARNDQRNEEPNPTTEQSRC